MAATLAQFRKTLTEPDLRPVYLLAGSEHLLVLEAADALRARARELAYLEREVYDADARFDWDELARAGSALSLFASRKLIDLRLPTGKPGKEGAAAISAYCQAPPPDTVLLITAQEWSKQHEGAWVAALERAGLFVPVWPLKREELPGWIGARFAARGLKATPDAVDLLAERVEGNLLAAAQEIDKLVLLAPDGRVDAGLLESAVADDARYDAFRLTDAALGGDVTRALRIIQGLREEGEDAIPLLGWILNQLRLLQRLAAAGDNLGAAFRSERVWDSRQSLYRRALKSARATHWEACLAQAARIDAIAKGRRDGEVWRELERLIAAIASPRQAAALISAA